MARGQHSLRPPLEDVIELGSREPDRRAAVGLAAFAEEEPEVIARTCVDLADAPPRSLVRVPRVHRCRVPNHHDADPLDNLIS